MPPITHQDAMIRARLHEARDDLAAEERVGQEATLDDVFRMVGYVPTWEEWHAYAREFLPAYHRYTTDFMPE